MRPLYLFNPLLPDFLVICVYFVHVWTMAVFSYMNYVLKPLALC